MTAPGERGKWAGQARGDASSWVWRPSHACGSAVLLASRAHWGLSRRHTAGGVPHALRHTQAADLWVRTSSDGRPGPRWAMPASPTWMQKSSRSVRSCLQAAATAARVLSSTSALADRSRTRSPLTRERRPSSSRGLRRDIGNRNPRRSASCSSSKASCATRRFS